MTKRYLYIFFLLIALACEKEEDFLKNQPTVGFYPVEAAITDEESGETFTVTVEASQVLTTEGTLTIEISNRAFVIVSPTPENGKLTLTIPAGETSASFTVQAGNDKVTNDYNAVFTITETTGGIKSIASNKTFVLQVVDGDYIFTDDFESGALTQWTTYHVESSNEWDVSYYSNNNYAVISNYSSDVPAEGWLIAPAIDFDNYNSETLIFESETAYNEDENLLEVVVLTDYAGTGDPSGSTMVKLSPALDDHRGSGYGQFTTSGTVDLSTVTGVGYVAFHYTAVNSADGSQWQVDNVKIKGVSLVNEGSSDEVFTLPFTDDFETCEEVGDYSIPSNWNEQVIDGYKTDRGWGCRDKGVDDSWAVNASAYGGEDGEDNAWLISASKFDLRSVSSAYLTFAVKSEYSGAAALTVYWSATYSGTGSPTNATWTTLSDVDSQLPSLGSNTYVTVTSDLSAAVGQQIYLAFQYSEGTSAESGSYIIDDLAVTEDGSTDGNNGGSTGNALFSEDFTDCSALNTLTSYSVTGDQVWSCNGNGEAGDGVRMSGYANSSNNDNEDWLITPAIDLGTATTPILTFDSDVKYEGETLVVLISPDYTASGDPNNASWTTLTVTLDTDDDNYDTWTSSGNVSLADYIGSSVYIAFKYTSTSSASSTWTLDNVLVTDN